MMPLLVLRMLRVFCGSADGPYNISRVTIPFAGTQWRRDGRNEEHQASGRIVRASMFGARIATSTLMEFGSFSQILINHEGHCSKSHCALMIQLSDYSLGLLIGSSVSE